MLKDRPAMQKYISSSGKILKNRLPFPEYLKNDGVTKEMTEDDSIWQWAARKFAGEDLPAPIDWHPEPPEKSSEIMADHVPPSAYGRGFVRARETYPSGPKQGQKVTFEDLWCNVIFELHNIANFERFTRLFNEAATGTLTKDEWVKIGTSIEFETLKRHKEFYRNIWRPWAEKNSLIMEPDCAFLGYTFDADSYDAWIKSKRENAKYYVEYWEKLYDEYVASYLKNKSSQEKTP